MKTEPAIEMLKKEQQKLRWPTLVFVGIGILVFLAGVMALLHGAIKMAWIS